MKRIKDQFSPAMVLALMALFVALGGSAYAIGKNSVGTNQLKNNAVTSKKLKNNAVTTAKISGYERIGIKRVVSSTGVDYETARKAAKKITLFKAGPFTIYGKCFRDEANDENYVQTFVKTSQDGTVMESDEDDLQGDPFLDKDTPEVEREGQYTSVNSPNEASYYGMHSTEISLMSPSGTSLEARVPIAVKRGNLPGGNGIYKSGDVCLFSGDMTVFSK